jgi:zinc transporter ZupT
MLINILGAALLIMLASFAGVLFIHKTLNAWMHRNLRFLITFSSGVFIIIGFDLIREVLEHSTSVVFACVWILAGLIIVELISRLFSNKHHHHDVHEHNHNHTTLDARRMLLGDAFHNIGDGIFLVSAFMLSTYTGFAAMFAIFIHEIAQSVSEFFVLKESHYSTSGALLRIFSISSTTLIGVFLAYVLSSTPTLETPLLAFAASSFIYVIFRDLLPHSYHSVRERGGLRTHVIALIAGIILMLSLGALFPHQGLEDAPSATLIG